MKTKHDHDCASRGRPPARCDCDQGEDRRILRRARSRFKRQRQAIAERTGLTFEETVVEVKPREVYFSNWAELRP